MQNKVFGRKGEAFAVQYLASKGYGIIDTNVYIGGGEIDIIAKKNKVFIFIEVKTRRSEVYVDLIDTLSDEKVDTLQTSCEAYIAQNDLNDCEYRIDLVGIIIKKERVMKIIHEQSVI